MLRSIQALRAHIVPSTTVLTLVLALTAPAHSAPVDIVSTPGSATGSLSNQVTGSIAYDQTTNLLGVTLTNNATDPDNHIVGFVFNAQGNVTLSESSFPSQPDSGPWEMMVNPTSNAPFGNFEWGARLTKTGGGPDGLTGIPQPGRGVEQGDTGYWEFHVSGPDEDDLLTTDFLDKISSGQGNNGFDAGFVVRLQGAEVTDKVGMVAPSPAAAGAGLLLLGGMLLRRPAARRV